MKKLQDMSLEELWQLFPIVVKEHNPQYVEWYKEEQVSLQQLLSVFRPQRISHVGSTAVKGLPAKPIVDVLLELPEDFDMDKVSETLCDNGWLVMARDDAQRTLGLNKGYTQSGFEERVFHLHVRPYGDWKELYFRDYLIAHSAIAEEYGRLKLSLKKRFEHNRDAYTEAKSDFILEHTQKARQEFGDRYLPYILKIRESEPQDLPQLLELLTYLHDTTMPEIDKKLEALWCQITNDPNYHIFAGTIDGKIISSCVLIIVPNLTHNQRPYALIENVITHPDYRAKGYATSLLGQATMLAKKHGCYKIMLMTGSKKDSTLRFYEKAGFNCHDKTAFIQWLK